MTEQTKTPRTDLIVAELNIEPSESVRYARMERHATALERELATQSALIAEMLEALEKIASFAPGNGDVCEIIAKTARAALARAADIGGA